MNDPRPIASLASLEALPPDLLQRVAQLYEELHREIEPHEDLCRMRGVCCDFPKAGHTLFASELEVRYMLSLRPVDWSAEGALCPFWKQGLCTAREERPLGCRTYFCDPSWRDRGEEMHERYHRKLIELAEEFGLDYRYQPWVDSLRNEARVREGSQARREERQGRPGAE